MKISKRMFLALAAMAFLLPTLMFAQSQKPAPGGKESKKASSTQAATAKGGTEVPTQLQQALIALDKQWGESAVKGDTATLGKILSDKFVGIDENGKLVGKQEQLTATTPSGSNVQNASYTADEYKFESLAPNVILMTHRATTKGTQDGKEVTESHRSLHVLEKTGGQWQVVANAQLPIKE